MPEMPEVETMTSRLERYAGWKITGVRSDETISAAAAERYIPGKEREAAIGETIVDVCRRGKMIIFLTDHGAMVCHNAMSGYWDESNEPWTFDYVEGQRSATERDVRVWLDLSVDEMTVTLRFHDARMFGSLHFMDPNDLADKLSRVGPEIMSTKHLYDPSEVITIERFGEACQANKSIKEVLMDQGKMAGLGNIYAAEALWMAHIDPTRAAKTLDVQEQVNLLEASRSVMNAALDRSLNYAGLKVYRRQKCSNCNGKIWMTKIGGRSTYWCPACQK